MYKPHPHFNIPEAKDTKVWRYMDLTKLFALLEYSNLLMVRSDKFTDKHEGSIASFNLSERSKTYENYDSLSILFKQTDQLSNTMRPYVYLNCWHVNDLESAAMWDLYSSKSGGIAIQSTFNRLIKSLVDKRDLTVGLVKYIDYNTEWMPEGNIYYPFFHKRKSFMHEQELRILANEDPYEVGKGNVAKVDLGITIKVNLLELIENIYIHPNTPEWQFETIKLVLRKYKFLPTAIKSDLYSIK